MCMLPAHGPIRVRFARGNARRKGDPMTLLELLHLLRHHLKLVIALPVACALIIGAYSYLFMPNAYTASTTMYVLMPSGGTDSTSTTYTDLNSSQLISNDIATLIDSDLVTKEAAAAVGLEDLSDFDISIQSETNTRVISCSVTGDDPAQAADVANALASSVSNVAQEVMNVQSVNVIDEAQAPTAPSGPNRPLYVAVGLMAGLFAAVAIVVLMDIIDTRVRADEVQELLGVPVIGRVPVIKGGF